MPSTPSRENRLSDAKKEKAYKLECKSKVLNIIRMEQTERQHAQVKPSTQSTRDMSA